jgi:TetR/AcrR family transcriptional regulator, repressor for neighboring sulfatase
VKAVTKRVRRTPAEARDAILLAARDRLLRLGLDGLKIADVAADVGMSHATLIHHFGSSAGMRRALVERMANELLTEFMGVIDGEPPSPARLGEMLGKLFRTLSNDRHAQLFAWLALEAADSSEDTDRATETLLHAFLERIGRHEGSVDGDSARFGVALAITSAIGLGIARPWLDRMRLMPSDDVDAFARWFAELLRARRAVASNDR